MLKIAILAGAMILAAGSAALWAKSVATHPVPSAPHSPTISPYDLQLKLARILPDQEIQVFVF
jgi:hypothetical protein